MKRLCLMLLLFSSILFLSSCSLFDHITEKLITVSEDSQTMIDALNTASTISMKANVMVEKTERNNSWLSTSESVSQGSGVIFYEDTSYYYCLTNNHVVAVHSLNTTISYEITNYLMQKSSASLVFKDADYDLCVLKFSKGKGNLVSLDLAEKNPLSGDFVISIGQPLGQMNYITLGIVKSYVVPTIADSDSDINHITFEVIVDDAPMNSGSSGGMLLNYSQQIVGINFAVGETDQQEFRCAYSVPVLKVKECLDIHSFYHLD